jgi:hypothetical protein
MELELYRQVLKRFGWGKDDTASDEESETFSPPAELKTVLRGISLHSKRGGYWVTLDDYDHSEIVHASPEELEHSESGSTKWAERTRHGRASAKYSNPAILASATSSRFIAAGIGVFAKLAIVCRYRRRW